MKNLNLILFYSKNAFQTMFFNPFIFWMFLISKIIRLVLFVMFLHFLFKGTSGLVGFSQEQIIFFFLSFNMVDTAAQLLFREVYRFRPMIVSGGLDFILLKPFNPLVRVLFGGPDPMDLVMLIIITGFTVWFGQVNFHPSATAWLGYLLLVINGLLIAAGFHILVLGLGIISTSVDHLIMIYRDFTSLLRIPVDVYVEPIRFLLTFIIPLGIMLTFPAKILMNLLSPQLIAYSLLFSLITIFLAVKFWNFSLRQYSSASS